MITIVPIILIVILAFIALCNGDSSGVEAIGKIILYIALFFGVGAIIIYAPWLILVVIVCAIILAVASSNNSKNNYTNDNVSNENQINYDQQEEKIESPKNLLVDNSNLTDFQKQLQENTKTPQQVEDENWLKEKEQILIAAKNDLSAIKRTFLDKAKNGQYTTISDKKCICVEYYCSSLLSYIDRQYSRNPTGKMGTSSYRTNEKVSYCIGKVKQYNLYLAIIRKLAAKSNVSINPFFTERDIVNNRENRITMPYTFTHKYGIGVSTHQIKAYLECTIQY